MKNSGKCARIVPTAKQLFWVLIGTVLVRLGTLPAFPILDRTEARYAYIAELMVQTRNWVTPFFDHGIPYWGKPILSFWLTAISFTFFGINAFAARLPAFLIFAVSTWLVFRLGSGQRNREFGLAAACIFASAALTFYLGGTVETDPAIMLGVTLTMTSFWKCVGQSDGDSRAWGYLFFIGIVVGLLAKGPIGAILPGMSIVAWATVHRQWAATWRRLPWVAGTVLTLLLVLPWYALAEHRTPGFLHYFIVGEHFQRFLIPHWKGDLYGAGRPHPRGSIWLFALLAALPWSAALAVILARRSGRQAFFTKQTLRDRWLSYLFFWLLAPLILFTLAANVLVTYIAPGLAAVALLAAHVFAKFAEPPDWRRFRYIVAIVPFLFLLAAIVTLVKPGASYVPSQANIVAAFKKATHDGSTGIVYAFDFPYSAKFYTGGQAKYVGRIDEMTAALRESRPYFVIPVEAYPKLPEDLRKHLVVVTEQNRHMLLKPKP
jgi:4-amino-4-deoxy-L-arabinose transferase-like glycosyltransferase